MSQSTLSTKLDCLSPTHDTNHQGKFNIHVLSNNTVSIEKPDGSSNQYSSKEITALFQKSESGLDTTQKKDKKLLSDLFREPIAKNLGQYFKNLDTPEQITFVEKAGFRLSSVQNQLSAVPGPLDKDSIPIPGFFVVSKSNGDLAITEEIPDGKAQVNQIDFSKPSESPKFCKTKEMFFLNNKIINSAAYLIIKDNKSQKYFVALLQTGANSYQVPAGSTELADIKRDENGTVMLADSIFNGAVRELAEEVFGLPKEESSAHVARNYLAESIGLLFTDSPLVQIEDRGKGDYIRAGRPEFNINTCLSPAVIISCEVEDVEQLQTNLVTELGHEDQKPVLLAISDLLDKADRKDIQGKPIFDFRGANFTIKELTKGKMTGERANI